MSSSLRTPPEDSDPRRRDDSRGQALTLEAVTAALLLLVAVSFALQMTAVTPLSASTSSQHLENQLQKTGEGVLASSAENESLKRAVLDWNETEQAFIGADESGTFRDGPPENSFGTALDAAYGDRNIAYNIVIHYHTTDGEMREQEMVDQGEPSDHAVSSSRTLTLDIEDELADGTPLPEADFFAPNLDDDSVYNLVRVEVVSWRI